MGRDVNIGILGLGWIAQMHLPAVRDSKHARLAGVYDANDALLEQTARQWQTHGYGSYEEMLEDKGIDAVVVCTPHVLHYDNVMSALHSHKHVLVEKPAAIHGEQVREMREAASANGVVFMPADNFVHRPPFDEAKSLLERGALGRISYAMFSTSHFLPGSMIQGWRRSVRDTGGGALIDSGSHLIHEMLYLLGKPEQLCGCTSRVFYKDFEGEDVAVVTLRYPSGTLVQVFQGWASADHSPTPEVKILGTNGALWISDALYLQQWGDDYQYAEFLAPTPPAQKLSANVSYQESFKYQMDYFCRCITEGATPRPTVEDSEVMLAIVHGAYDSDKEHRMMQLLRV